METDASNSVAAVDIGLGIPSPPSLAGKARMFRSRSFGGALPVSAGITRCRIPGKGSGKRLVVARDQFF